MINDYGVYIVSVLAEELAIKPVLIDAVGIVLRKKAGLSTPEFSTSTNHSGTTKLRTARCAWTPFPKHTSLSGTCL